MITSSWYVARGWRVFCVAVAPEVKWLRYRVPSFVLCYDVTVKSMLQKVFSFCLFRPKSSVLMWLVIDKSASFFSEWKQAAP
eukprot:scaffold5738_cov117-Skeletonema_marinoi.AAC.1